MNLFNQLVAFEKSLNEIKAPILKNLNKGISISGDIKNIPVLSDDLRVFYGWKNGTNISTHLTLGQLWIFNMGIFSPIERAIEIYSGNVDQLPKWEPSMFPLFESGGGEYYLMECDKNKKDYGRIYFHSIGEISFDILISKYDSLSTLIHTIHQCYLHRAYFFDEDDCLQFDFIQEVEISKTINPLSDFWRLDFDQT